MPVRTKLILASIVLAIGLGGALLFRRGSKTPSAEPAPSQSLPLRAGAGLGDFSARFDTTAPLGSSADGKLARKPSQPTASTGSAAPLVAPPELPSHYEKATGGMLRADLEPNAEPLPADSPARQLPVPRSHAAQPRKHKVVDGDTLATLAKRYLGSGDRYMDLFDANRPLLTDPDVLPIGVELVVPDRNAKAASAPATAPGDSTLVPIPRGSLRKSPSPDRSS